MSDYELQREYSLLDEQLRAGEEVHPEEIWQMCQRLIEAGETLWAQQLGEFLPDRD